MREIVSAIPDVEVFLALPPEELAGKILFFLRRRNQAKASLPNLQSELWYVGQSGPAYPQQRSSEIGLAFTEAWAWLEAQGLIVPDEGINGQNGWRRLSRRAHKMESAADFASFRTARLIPRELLHASIAEKVWLAFVRGEFDNAAFQAMKAVEVSVRNASELGADVIGVDLMRKAFHPESGPLTDPAAEAGERIARAALFAGAIGSYKNPHSHRDVNMDDPGEAMEIIFLANHLLRIVDARAPHVK